MHKHRQKHRHHKRRAYKKNKKGPLDPSVILGTNDAPISVELSLLSPPGEFEKRRTLVQASTKRGDIDMHIVRHYNLEGVCLASGLIHKCRNILTLKER